MNKITPNHVIFHEVQTVRTSWIWGLVIIPPVIMIYGMIQQLVFKKPWGNNPMSDAGLVIVGLMVIIGPPLFVYFVRLEIQIRNDGVYYRYAPFHLRFQCIQLTHLKSYQIIQYRPLRDYGGWGIRYGKYGKAYTLSGNTGFQLVTADQKKILLGTLKAEELKRALDSIR